MFNYDFHIHTELCGHAPGLTVEKILLKADELGLEIIAITDHISSPEDMKNIDIIRSETQKYNTNCRVLIGAEIDVDRRYTDGRLVLDKRAGLDYILGTIHYLPGTDVMPHCDPSRPLTSEETCKRWRSTLLGLVANPLIDTLAHPGMMIANALPEEMFSGKVMDVFVEAAEISAENGVAWGLNNLCKKKLTERQQKQYFSVIQLAVDAGVHLVYGSDAHCPEDIGNTDFVSKVSSMVGNIEKALKYSISPGYDCSY